MRVRKADEATIPDLVPLPGDPHPYLGPLRTAKGTRAFNHYFWPTWQATARDDLNLHRLDSRWNLAVVALNDGRVSTSGFIWDIEPSPYHLALEGKRRRCVFPDHAGAVRAAAALLIVRARNSRTWDRWVGGLSEDDCADVIHWARCIAAREAGKPEPKRLPLRPLPVKPKPPPDFSDMPLFAAT